MTASALEGLHRDDAVHSGVPARLEHQSAAEVVVLLARFPPLVEDRGSGQLGVAAGHDADRLAGGVHVRDVKFHRAFLEPPRNGPRSIARALAADRIVAAKAAHGFPRLLADRQRRSLRRRGGSAGWKAQPGGGSSGLGNSVPTRISGSFAPGRGDSTEARSAAV